MKNFFIKLLNKIKSVSLLTYLVIAFSIWLLIFAPLDAYELHINSKIPLTENPIVVQIIAYVTIIIFIALLLTAYFWAFPLIRLVLGRIGVYFRLYFAALGFKFKLKRFPLASLFGVKIKEDILIKNSEKTFCIHFIDVVGRGRVFSILNANEYDISRTTPDAPKNLGASYYGGATGARLAVVLSSTIRKGETKKFPEFDPSTGEHIIMLDPLPMEVRYIDSSVPKPLFSGYSVGNITYYEAKDFIRFLKRI